MYAPVQIHGGINAGDTVHGKSENDAFSRTRQTVIPKQSSALQSVESVGDRIEIEDVTNANHLNKFVNKVAVRGRILHFETEQDDMLAKRELLP
jgi:hypothetical protein